MLRFDRYLLARSHPLDLASGNRVDIERITSTRRVAALFTSRVSRTLIDLDADARGRIEIWEHWRPTGIPHALEDTRTCFDELLEGARFGAPRAFDLVAARVADRAYLCRVLARDARLRGWVPIAAEVLGIVTRGGKSWPSWLIDRSLVVFAAAPGLSGNAALALLRLARRDARPHVLVRGLADREERTRFLLEPLPADTVHERRDRFGAIACAASPSTTAADEAAARWALIVGEMTGGAHPGTVLDLAEVLIARAQPFEAGALLARTGPLDGVAGERRAQVGQLLRECVTPTARGWEMLDDFVGVLQICQDIEDEQTALARVGAYVRERLQASTVAFVAREAHGPRVLTRVGSDAARLDLAVRSIETGVAIPAERDEGPVESACPVRHAAEVIGALWCRWGAGMPVAAAQATTLLGVAAAAAAPSLRLAIARREVRSPERNPVPELIGDSAAMAAVRDAILRAAASPFPVVIEGESGSGKELAARAIHAHSSRRERRFCAINCAALVDELVEAELFGHVRGAFTGATTDRPGLFEDANGGVLFLDEVAELGARVQAKLLRVLQEGEVRRLGESAVRRADVRIVAATNCPLAREVAEGRFRKDLWYRLDVIRLCMPPLRARIEDLPALVAHIWRSLATRTGSRAILSPSAVSALALYDWPGNVRELQNVLASLMVATPQAGLIKPAALPSHIARVAATEGSLTLDDARRQFEQRYVRAALARAGGRMRVAARELGVTRQGLSKLMGRLGIERGIPHNGQ